MKTKKITSFIFMVAVCLNLCALVSIKKPRTYARIAHESIPTATMKAEKTNSPLLRVQANCLLNNAHISYTVVQEGHIKICIYDIDGRVVDMLVDDHKTIGSYSTVWYFKNRAACSYTCQYTNNKEFQKCASFAILE